MSCMKRTLTIDFNQINQPELFRLLNLLDDTFTKHQTPYYVLGAIASDTWFAQVRKRSRLTRDLDVAVHVATVSEYDDVLNDLIQTHGFNTQSSMKYTVRSPNGDVVDILPFGEISIDDAVDLDPKWNRPIYVNGFQEIHEKGTAVVNIKDEDLSYRVATLPAIVLLKLISYDDRPEKRHQDPGDIAEIIQSYFDIEDMLIYEEHNVLFDRNLELHEIAAIVIGRQIRDISADNSTLHERIEKILSLKEPTQQKMVEQMASDELSIEQVERWFEMMRSEIA